MLTLNWLEGPRHLVPFPWLHPPGLTATRLPWPSPTITALAQHPVTSLGLDLDSTALSCKAPTCHWHAATDVTET